MRESKREEAKEKNEKTTDEIQIQKEELEKIKEEVNDGKNKNNEKNGKKYKEIIKNISVGCGIIIYFVILLLGKDRIPTLDYFKALKVIIVCDLLSSLVLLEVGFRNDKFNVGIHGIEMAFVGGFTVFILDLFSKMKNSFYIWFSIIIAFVTVYYLAKSIIIVVKRRGNS